MKKRTFYVLTHLPIPIIGGLIKFKLEDPFIGSSRFIEDGYGPAFAEFSREHPDIAITRKISDRIMREDWAKRHPIK